jgi:hypothetical protein
MHEAMAGTPRLKWLVDNFVGPGFEAFDRAVRLAIEADVILDLPVSEVTSIITSAGIADVQYRRRHQPNLRN